MSASHHHEHGPSAGSHDHGGHAHSHGAGHSHAPADFGRAFAIGITLNIVYVAVEAGYGWATGSLALLADAGHNLSDVLGLAAAWAGSLAARAAPTQRYTFGFGQATILAAMFNAVLLLVASAAIAYEAVQRFIDPAPVPGGTVIVVAAIGVAINAATAMLFMRGRADDLNVRGAFLHMAADALVSVGVIVAGVGIMLTGMNWIDPVTSLVIVAVIIVSGWSLMIESIRMAMSAVPARIDGRAVRASLLKFEGVADLHDLHVWPMSTTRSALTAHLVMPGGHPGDAAISHMADEIRHHFGIAHVTLQVETGALSCPQADHA